MATARQDSLTVEEAIREAGRSEDDAHSKTYLLLLLSPDVDRTIGELTARTGLPKADVLNMAAGFLKAADAIAEGKRVGIVGEDQGLEFEFKRL